MTFKRTISAIGAAGLALALSAGIGPRPAISPSSPGAATIRTRSARSISSPSPRRPESRSRRELGRRHRRVAAKVKAGDPNWDVVQVEAEELALGCADGFYEKIDWDKLGGKDKFLPAGVHDCGVGAIVWSTLLSYDGDRLKEAPTSWADFWDTKKFPGKRGLRRGPKYALEFALMADGVPPADVYKVLRTPEGVDRAFKKLDEIKPDIVWWESGAQPLQLLASGEVVMTTAYNGRITGINKTEGKNFKVVWPGSIYAIDSWVILKDSPNKDAGDGFHRVRQRAGEPVEAAGVHRLRPAQQGSRGRRAGRSAEGSADRAGQTSTDAVRARWRFLGRQYRGADQALQRLARQSKPASIQRQTVSASSTLEHRPLHAREPIRHDRGRGPQARAAWPDGCHLPSGSHAAEPQGFISSLTNWAYARCDLHSVSNWSRKVLRHGSRWSTRSTSISSRASSSAFWVRPDRARRRS